VQTLVAATLMAQDNNPAQPRSMTLMAGPIDTRLNPTKVNELAQSKPISWFRDNVRRLRPEHSPVDPSDRLIWLPGDAAQCDLWFPPRKIPLEDGSQALLPVLVITAAHSRFMLARMVPTRHTAGLLLGMWELLQQLGRVPRRLIWDNEPGIGRGKRHADGVGEFAGTMATTVQRLRPYDPESKGLVERRNGFFETSFMPGRTFASPGDFDAQFADWLAVANARIVRTIKTRPVDRLDADRAAMLTCRQWPSTRMGQPSQAGTRLLRPRRQQRLLRRPRGDRPFRRRGRGPDPRRSPPRRTAHRCP
jgi:hypothetical protein